MIPKFRGFRTKTKEWVEGNLIYREEPYLHDIVTPVGNSSTISYAVERDSIGQWTGLKDQNGVEIYEGDILYFEPYKTHSNDRVVEYIDGAYHGRLVRNGYSKLLAECVYETKVIGNIYENPELLEVTE